MKNLVLGSLIAIGASGCIITTGDDDAYITAAWGLSNIATNTATGCPANFDTAALYNQPIDANLNNAGPVVIDLFDCVASRGTSAPLAPGPYLSWIEIANHDNTAVYAKSTSAVVDVTSSDKSFTAQILNDGGYFQFAWQLRGASSNASLSCAQAGLVGGPPAGVQLQAFVSGSTESSSDIFDCEDGRGITAGYVQGSYDVLIDAINPNPVGSAPTIQSTIAPQNQVTSLGTINIPITGL
jgi:hypothetical protein